MLHFAVAGVPRSTPKPGGTVEGLKHAHSLGITAMEMEWVQSVPKNPDRLKEIRKTAEQLKMHLTVHAPYFVNLNSQDPAKLAASKMRVLNALAAAEATGARSVCVHAAFNLGLSPAQVYANVYNATEEIMASKKKLFPNVNLAYETMGKHAQFGTLEEVLAISKEFGNFPCLDPAHMHARTNGKINTTEEWNDMFDMYEKYMGKKALKHVHMHFSGIAYGPSGEKHHEPIQESDANWKDFLKVLKKRGIEGNLVSESPLLEDDTLFLKRSYEKL